MLQVFKGSISGTELNSVGDFQNFGLTGDINFQSCILLPSFFKQTAKKTRVDLFLYRLALKNGLQLATWAKFRPPAPCKQWVTPQQLFVHAYCENPLMVSGFTIQFQCAKNIWDLELILEEYTIFSMAVTSQYLTLP